MNSAIILCGGTGSRMGGREKGLLRIDGETFIERKIRILSEEFTDILLVTNTPELYDFIGPGVRIVPDRIPYGGALAALYTGLEAAEGGRAFVTTSDTPFLVREMAAYLYRESEPYDGFIGVWQGKIEPLCSVYSKTCLPHMERTLPEKRIRSFYPFVRTRTAPEAEIRRIDPEGRSFININTEEDYARYFSPT